MKSFQSYLVEMRIPKQGPSGMSPEDWQHQYKAANIETSLEDAKRDVLFKITNIIDSMDSEVYRRLYHTFQHHEDRLQITKLAMSLYMQYLKNILL